MSTCKHHTGCQQDSNSLLPCSLAGRELQRWAPEASDDLTGMLLESEPAQKSKAPGRWDQFAANQQLFGTATSYNEDIYTTKLDAGASGISVQEAERLAAEIQAGATSNRHMAEERGARVNDSGVRLCPASAWVIDACAKCIKCCWYPAEVSCHASCTYGGSVGCLRLGASVKTLLVLAPAIKTDYARMLHCMPGIIA